MVKTNLTDEEKSQIIVSLNNDTEPPPELMHKLFPRCTEKYDVAKLDRAKVAMLEYSGKRSEASILNEAVLSDTGSPLQIERYFVGGVLTGHPQLDLFNRSKEQEDSDWQNLIVQGDNLQFLKTCYQNADPLIKDKVKGKVKLVYIDPPFATKSDFKGSGNQRIYSDRLDSAEFIENLRERLIYLRNLLAENGCIYIHLDHRKTHYIKIILDELFGESNFLSEIIWLRSSSTGSSKAISKKFPTNHDSILFYSNNSRYTYNRQFKPYSDEYLKRFSHNDEDGKGLYRISDLNTYSIEKLEELKNKNELLYPQKKGGNYSYKRYLKDTKGVVIDDVWTDINFVNPMAAENTGYKTQKPESLLKRIINTSSNEGDLIMDVFAGSGTSATVAEKLGRRWIMCDFGKHAIYTMQKRIIRIGESKELNSNGKKNKKYGKNPKPFCVVSCGAYDFSRIMSLRENKDVYINFVLGLFQIKRDYKRVTDKYKLANIYGEKDGNPVEIYPVWEDEYLKDVRIDGDYLKEIITQSGGKLKGDYYIITPETCTVITDTVLKNDAGKDVHFKLLKFPYKILEDVSRNFQLHEQPSSQENVNDLINSTGFYFNNDVDLEVKKINGGLEITKFNTSILNKNGEKYKDLEGLAMLLVDIDYDDKIFDMEKTVFFKDFNDKNEIKISGLTDSIAVVAIDKHGNESKPFILKSK